VGASTARGAYGACPGPPQPQMSTSSGPLHKNACFWLLPTCVPHRARCLKIGSCCTRPQCAQVRLQAPLFLDGVREHYGRVRPVDKSKKTNKKSEHRERSERQSLCNQKWCKTRRKSMAWTNTTVESNSMPALSIEMCLVACLPNFKTYFKDALAPGSSRHKQ